ncbi:MAG: hypothetical protein RMJ36_00545 [Candidatus Calescibacterium sp.]|nr:hypothetical protein [Candidatus Calescibacterium sp.]MDW8132133.1 hypothetical protein [Candidatus Calescibacterium sp.]
MKNLIIISMTSIFMEVVLIYLYFLVFFDYKLNSYSRDMAEHSLKRLDYNISKSHIKPMIMCIRDYISWGGSYQNLVSRREKIEEVLKNNFLTSDAYYLSKATLDENNKPFYLKNAKLSNDIYIKNISTIYYYTQVSREVSQALGESFKELLKNIPPNYKWIIDLLQQPTMKFARDYIINKLKEASKLSADPVLTSFCIGLLVSLDYRDEKFYNYFLGSSSPSVFVTSTVGLYITGRNSKLLEHEKYSYFVFNRPDTYRYYSVLLILKYTNIYPDIYLKLLNFDVLTDYKELTICIVMLLN